MTISGNVTGGTAPPGDARSSVAEAVTIGWGRLQKAFNAILRSHVLFSLNNAGADLGYDFAQGLVDVIFLVAAALLCIIMIAAFTFIAVEVIVAFLQANFCLPLDP